MNIKNKNVFLCLRSISAIFFLCIPSLTESKICWSECSDEGVITFAEVQGCHRRTPPPGRTVKFWCDGYRGPPCTIVKGETVILNVKINTDHVLKNVTQAAYWETNFGVDLPFAGLDTDCCKYLEGNQGCVSNEPIETQTMNFPIPISKLYPSGTYKLRWTFTMKDNNDNDVNIGCFRYVIRII